MNDSSSPPVVSLISLGCAKNLVDSEKMLGTLALDGYTLVSNPEGAKGRFRLSESASI